MATQPTPTVYRADDRTETLDTLVSAFIEDPGWRHIAPESKRRRKVLRAIFSIALRESGGDAWVVRGGEAVVGVATWPAPGQYPLSTLRVLRAAPAMSILAAQIGGGIRTLANFGFAIDAAFPTFPVRYLQMIGVHPDHQGRGIGRLLVEHGLIRADRLQEQVYLETSLESNVGYYEKFGFQVMHGSPATIFNGGPVMWRMLRPSDANDQPRP